MLLPVVLPSIKVFELWPAGLLGVAGGVGTSGGGPGWRGPGRGRGRGEGGRCGRGIVVILGLPPIIKWIEIVSEADWP